MEELQRLSKDLEAIVAPGGFRFKETLMSGDECPEDEELRKVLGLRWNTSQDLLAVDVRVNFGGKRKGAKLEEDTDLDKDDMMEYAPKIITKRML